MEFKILHRWDIVGSWIRPLKTQMSEKHQSLHFVAFLWWQLHMGKCTTEEPEMWKWDKLYPFPYCRHEVFQLVFVMAMLYPKKLGQLLMNMEQEANVNSVDHPTLWWYTRFGHTHGRSAELNTMHREGHLDQSAVQWMYPPSLKKIWVPKWRFDS